MSLEPMVIPNPLTEQHMQQLHDAKFILEHPSLAARVSDTLGTPIEKGIKLLPKSLKELVTNVTTKSLQTAMDAALYTLNKEAKPPAKMFHKLSVAATGALGGAFGLPALALELPVSTTIMLRSIAEIARAEGEQLDDLHSRMACLEVFALGGTSKYDDAVESGYFAIRAALAKTISDATKHLAAFGAGNASAPPLARMVAQLAARFSIPVSEKFILQATPVIGAAGGAAINSVFIDHYQAMAQGHFTIRRLERIYGPQRVKEAYQHMRTLH